MTWRVMWLLSFVGLGLGLALVSALLAVGHSIAAAVALGLVLGGWLVYHRIWQAQVRLRMTKLWRLADQLDYGAADLKSFAQAYTVLQWAASRPELLRFYPSRRIWQRVMRRLLQEQACRAVEQSRQDAI
ncbi:hypothetical protein [Lacticaseibacillus jixiensis]|uniref:hypothetical protein n=1 Tax=Lacticaseibacillus jixiensis TaxID=3231926 RepID=UPI0036F289B7